ncbi:MAG: cyclic nucleotide-binding domain-containing protein [Proteobacteria bacterium]|nr:cyclic nucleotide-binding domain-containing protein [Pseudomonadota bacterium]
MENVQLLKKVYLFHGLTSYELAKIGKELKSRHFDKDDEIIKAGKKGVALYIVKSGSVSVTGPGGHKKEDILSILGAGDHFGEISLLDDQPTSADVFASENSELIELSKKNFEKILSDESHIAVKIYKSLAISLCSKLRTTNENLLLLRKAKKTKKIKRKEKEEKK